jgi:endothelin-converting enzyme
LEKRQSPPPPASPPPPPAPAAAAAVCSTPKCIEYAKHIQQSLAPNYTAIDPCTDFDRYACDGWRNTHDYRPEQASLSVTSVMSDAIRDLLHSILEGDYVPLSSSSSSSGPALSAANATADVENFGKMKAAYDTCMYEDAIRAYGAEPLVRLLDEFEAVFPLAGPKVPPKWPNDELTDATIWLRRRGVGGIVSAAPAVRKKKPLLLPYSTRSQANVFFFPPKKG